MCRWHTSKQEHPGKVQASTAHEAAYVRAGGIAWRKEHMFLGSIGQCAHQAMYLQGRVHSEGPSFPDFAHRHRTGLPPNSRRLLCATSASPCFSSLSPVSQFLLQSMEVQGEENASVSHLYLQTQSLSSVTPGPPGCEEWAWGFLSPRSPRNRPSPASCLFPAQRVLLEGLG